MNWINLDRLAAQTAHRIIKVVEDNEKVKASAVDTFATKALGVLQEQGAYAGMLFLLSRSGDKKETSKQESDEAIACQIAAELLKLLNHDNLRSLGLSLDGAWTTDPGQVNPDKNKKEILDHFANNVSADIHKLLSIKSLFEQVLTYTRYSAKALSKSEDTAEGQSAEGGTS